MSGVRKLKSHIGEPVGLYVKRGKTRDTYYTMSDAGRYIGLGSDRTTAIEELQRLRGTREFAINPTAWAKELAGRCRSRAKRKGLVCNLDAAFIEEEMRAQRMRCVLSGERFREDSQVGKRIRMYVPSIDRIDPAKGYARENVRIVCAFVNLAFNEFGEDILRAAIGRRRRRSLETKAS